MRWAGRILGLLAFSAATAAHSGGTEDGMLFLNVRSMNRGAFEDAYASAPRHVAAVARPVPARSALAGRSASEVLTIDAKALFLFAVVFFRPAGTSPSVLQVPVDGGTVELGVVDVLTSKAAGDV